MFKKIFFIFAFLSSSATLSFADSVEQIKSNLQQDLLSKYLNKLESKLGSCGSQLQSCIQNKDNYLVANLPEREICFPYTVCGFYQCMEEKYRCSDVGVNYFTDLAFPTCQAYEKNILNHKFTSEGIRWIYEVMVCLQKGLIDECELNNNCPRSNDKIIQKETCAHITDFTLSYHPGCYVNSSVGVCHLPLKDKLAIWKTVNPFMTKRERHEAYLVIFECLRPNGVKK